MADPGPPLSGVVIAGGHARRLDGIPKGLLSLEGEPLIQRLFQRLEARCAQCFIVGDPDGPYQPLGVEIKRDLLPGKGAPGGLHAALHYAEHEWVYALSCDLPFMTDATLAALKPDPAFDVVMYHEDGRDQPLIALWRQSVMPRLTRLLETGNPGFSQILAGLRVQRLRPTTSIELTNVNTWADVEQAGLASGQFRSSNRG